jgi:DnaJ-class molecular chaperone
MAAILIGAVIVAAGYYVSLRIWPYRPCKRCSGGGRNAGSNRKRFGTCGRCGGSGRALRLGARMLNRGR